MSSPSVEAPAAMREITIAQAVNEALAEELRRDERVFVIGEDVAEAGTPFKVLSGLVEEFGPERILDSPISEAGITGLGVGAAMTGMRPVVDIMFGDFLTLVMDQLANQAAKTHYMSGGKLSVPLVLRTTLGATRRSAAQHSQSLQAWVAHVPGSEGRAALDAVRREGTARSPRSATTTRSSSSRTRWTGASRARFRRASTRVPLGVADVKRAGEDVTLVGTSSMVRVCLEAAELLAAEGISAEVVDPRTLVPLDGATRSSARRRRPAARSSSTKATAATASPPSSPP